MFWIIYPFAILGAAVTSVGLVFAFYVLLGRLRRPRVERAQEAFELGRRSVLDGLVMDGHWFSEDEPTMNAIQELGCGTSVDQVRERWRDARRRQAIRGENSPYDSGVG